MWTASDLTFIQPLPVEDAFLQAEHVDISYAGPGILYQGKVVPFLRYGCKSNCGNTKGM
jgi:hypothetical protein